MIRYVYIGEILEDRIFVGLLSSRVGFLFCERRRSITIRSNTDVGIVCVAFEFMVRKEFGRKKKRIGLE